MSSRKRRAPGASPQVQQQAGIQNIYPQMQDAGNISTEQYLNNWNDPSITGDMGTAFDTSMYGGFSGNLGGPGGQSNHNRIVSLDGLNDSGTSGVDAGSGQLVRRNPNQQLAARGSTPWDAFNNNGQQAGWEQVEDEDDELEQKAVLAKKEAPD